MKRLLAKVVPLATTVTAVAITFDEWRVAHFTAAEMTDANISGEAADPTQMGGRTIWNLGWIRTQKASSQGAGH